MTGPARRLRARRLAALRLVTLCALATIVSVVSAPLALADAAGPTDYRTDIVSVVPSQAPIAVEMIGGDAFLSLEQLEPVEVIVLGYQGEPYLRFDADGTVYENRRSPAVWLNEDRYGTDETPAFADADAAPQWLEVADGGRYAWHDHRSHWMNPQPPPSAEAGDQVLEATVPLLVGGEAVTITVASYLLDSPSMFPALLGCALGLIGAAFAWRSRRVGQALSAYVVASAATALGGIAYTSVPAETAPSPLLWLLPLLGAVAASVLIAFRNRTATTVYLDGSLVAAGALLAGWSIFRIDALRRALIPSDAPAWLDRLVVALALVVGAALTVQGMIGLVRPQRLMEVDANS